MILVQGNVLRADSDCASFRAVSWFARDAYAARLTADRSEVITCFECGGVAFEGFNVSNDRGALDGREYDMIHVSDLIGPPGGIEQAGRFILRNSVVHDSASEVLFKANNARPRSSLKETSSVMLGRRAPSNSLSISVSSARVIDNVFFGDFGAADALWTRQLDRTHFDPGRGVIPCRPGYIVVRGNVFFALRISKNSASSRSATLVLVYRLAMCLWKTTCSWAMTDAMKTPFDIQGVEHVRVRHNTTTGVANAQDSDFACSLAKGRRTMSTCHS